MFKNFCKLFVFVSVFSCATGVSTEMESYRYVRIFEELEVDEPITMGLIYQLNAAGDGYTWLSDTNDSPRVARVVVPGNFHGNKGRLAVTSVTSVGERTLGAKSVYLPPSIVELGAESFASAIFLSAVDGGKKIAVIGERAFFDCEDLQSFTLSPELKTIGKNAFERCVSFKITEIPPNVSEIGDGAFKLCSALTSVRIGQNVTVMGANVFDGCPNLTDIYCAASSKPAGWDEGWLGNCPGTVHWGR